MVGTKQLSILTVSENTVAAGATDTGLRRSHNEDTFLIDPELGLMVLADGMGGHSSGEVASNEAVTALKEFLGEHLGTAGGRSTDSTLTSLELPSPEKGTATGAANSTGRLVNMVLAAVLRANDRVYAINQDRGLPPEKSMGTTLVGIICAPGDPWCTVVFHVGDSRLYRLREGRIEQMTKDHSLHQDWLEGGRIGTEPHRNILTQGIGPRPHVTPAVFAPSFRPGDVLLLCSDGLSDLVDEAQLQRHLLAADPQRLDLACQALIAAANERGGRDNITVVLAARL
jgi:protein phosphatase